MKKILVLLITVIMCFSVLPALGSGGAFGKVALEEKTSNAPATSLKGTFAFVSDFENGGTYSSYGWQLSGHGPVPAITQSVNYFGEPSVQVSRGESLTSSSGITQGDQFVSFQAAIYAAGGEGAFRVVDSAGNPVASVAISGTEVFAGGSALHPVGQSPMGTVYPSGWTYISGNIQNTSTNKVSSWTMQLFVDQTDTVFANISVPNAYQYSGIQLAAISGNAYFTSVVFSTYQIPIYDPGYNPMEGYGQGSGLVVSLLHPFTILHANMKLNSWSVPENNIMSFQINAMNNYGTTTSTCVGFFQLGVDLGQNGAIAPWYVPGKNCIAHYFVSSNNPAAQPGFVTPAGTLLGLTIEDEPATNSIFFQIIDYSVSVQSGDRYWNATIPYSGTEFYGTYTQLEFQPSSAFPIDQYYLNGSLFDMGYGSSFSSLSALNASYMLPFTLNAPATWSYTYYNAAESGYSQIG